MRSSFISKKLPSENHLLPTLLTNNYRQNKKILASLEEELKTCLSFDFSVAFINDSGLACILQTLEYLSGHNIPGRILTTNYLNFTSPGALSKLLEFPNIEVRAYTEGGFHPKGYIFEQTNYYSIIIGSANLTASALNQNQEWSIKFLSLTDGQLVFSVREEFETVWNKAKKVTPEWITDYTIDYNLKRVNLKSLSKSQIEETKKEHLIETYTETHLLHRIWAVPAIRQVGLFGVPAFASIPTLRFTSLRNVPASRPCNPYCVGAKQGSEFQNQDKLPEIKL